MKFPLDIEKRFSNSQEVMEVAVMGTHFCHGNLPVVVANVSRIAGSECRDAGRRRFFAAWQLTRQWRLCRVILDMAPRIHPL